MNAKATKLQHLGRRKKICFAVISMILSTVLSLFIVEQSLRYLTKYRHSQARKHPDYGDTWRSGGLGPGGYLKEGFSAQLIGAYGETVRWKNNSQGFRNDQDFAPSPPPGTLRILSLGDSFTAGYRIDQDDTYSKQLEDWSTASFGPTEALVSSIEHPHTGLTYLKDRGHKWSPHIVLLGITLGNDIAQSYVSLHPDKIGFNHGLESLDLPDECLLERKGWDKIMARTLSWIYRRRVLNAISEQPKGISSWYRRTTKPKLFDAINGLGMFISIPPAEIEEAYHRLFRILMDFKTFCTDRGMRFAVLLFPQRYQVQSIDWQATINRYSLRDDRFDLMLPNRRIRTFCEMNSILCIDSTKFMKEYHQETKQNLYLPRGDMHWNHHGHKVWFEGAKPDLARLIQEKFEEIKSDQRIPEERQ
jgi:hypothetical protein